MGESIPEGWKFKLFPGLLPILFSAAALALGVKEAQARSHTIAPHDTGSLPQRWLHRLDILIAILFAISIPAVGFDRVDAFHGLFDNFSSERVLTLLTIAVVVRLCVAYPRFLPTARANLVETLRSEHRCDAFWLGSLLTVTGFCFSLGWNFFFFRICYELIPMFKSMRVVSRGALLAYLGLALLSGLGVKSLAERLRSRFPRLRAGVIYLGACGLLLFEMNAAPLQIMRGEVNPDAVTLRLKQTPMRGGLVVLPAGGDFNHRYMLRSADHQKPLIVGTSGFNSPIEDRIEDLTRTGSIHMELLDLFETLPASYIVIENKSIAPERRSDYQEFLARGIVSGRLRFINHFEGGSDLYAVVKTEPESRSEAGPSVDLSIRDWAAKLADDPVTLLGQTTGWSQQLYRIHMARSGAMPRYKEFIKDVESIGRGVVLGSEMQDQQFNDNLRRFLEDWIHGEAFTRRFGGLDNAQYVERLRTNAGIDLDPAQRLALVNGLSSGQETRAGVLLKIAEDPAFIKKEKDRSLLLLHYFGYLRRNPDDPPDGDLRGFNFWLKILERNGERMVSLAFKESPEYVDNIKRK
jgi:succinate dehydrogenase/fumarate reductase cytochrome b subunit